MRPLLSMLYNDRSVNQSNLANFTSLIKKFKEFHFLKGPSIISLNFSPYLTVAQVPKNIGKATTCTFYALRQHNMLSLILSNPNKSFMAAILKNTCHHS